MKKESSVTPFYKYAMPLNFKNTMRSAKIMAATTSIFGYGNVVIQCNSIALPMGGTNKPDFYDRMYDMYTYCTVVGSRIKVTPFFHSVAPLEAGQFSITCYIDDNGTPTLPHNTSACCKPGAKTQVYNTGNQMSTPVYLNWSLKKTFGATDQSQAQFEAPRGAPPTEGQYFVIQVVGQVSTNYGFLVEMESLCSWREIQSANTA